MITWKCYINFIKQYKCTSSDNELTTIQQHQLKKNQGEGTFFLSFLTLKDGSSWKACNELSLHTG